MSQAWDKEKIPSPYEVLMTCILHTARISNVNSVMFFDRKVEMVSFELGEELRKMFFRLVTSVGQRKKFWVPMRNQTSDLWICTLMLYLYQWQSSGAQIQRSEVRFLMGTQNFFFVPRSWQDENTSFLILHRAQNLPSLLFCQELFCGKNPASRNSLVYCFYQGRGARHSRLF